MTKYHSMRSFVDDKGKPIAPPYTKLKSYLKALEAHKGLQIGKSPGESMEREVKYTDVAEIKRTLRKIISLIGKANETRNRVERADILHDALKLVPDCFIDLRTLMDLHLITDKRWSQVTLSLEDLRRQLSGWYQSTLKEAEAQLQGAALKDDDFDLLYDIPESPGRRIARLPAKRMQGSDDAL